MKRERDEFRQRGGLARMVCAAVVCGLAALGGCGGEQMRASGSDSAQRRMSSSAFPMPAEKARPPEFFPPTGDSRDARPIVPVVVRLTAYRLSVPFGVISNSEDFWRHVDENAIDANTHDQLWRNGIRVGLAPSRDWDYFKEILSRNPVRTQQTASAGASAQAMELTIKPKVAYQNLFYYDNDGNLVGRTFDLSENVVDISFSPVPRHIGAVRVEACPGIRSLRSELEATVLNNETEVKYVRHEKFYDVNLTAEIPVDQFLIIGPSPEARESLRLGHAFLMEDGVAAPTEQILILSPQPFRFDAPATAPSGQSEKQ